MKKFIFLLAISYIAPLYAKTFEVECHDETPEIFPTSISCIGPVADIVERAITRQGHKLKWISQSWNDSLDDAKHGNIDMLVHHPMDKNRESFLNAIPYGYDIFELHYFTRADLNKKIVRIEDLNGLRIGADQYGFLSQEFKANKNITKFFYPSLTDLVEAFEKGEIDAVLTSGDSESKFFRAMDTASQAEYTETFAIGQYISIPKKSNMSQYYAKIKSEVDAMINSGEIDDIFNRYRLTPPDQM